MENGGKNCLVGCNKEQGKCDWCGMDGWCCRKDWVGNGCDGTFGGPSSHRCVLKPSMWAIPNWLNLQGNEFDRSNKKYEITCSC